MGLKIFFSKAIFLLLILVTTSLFAQFNLDKIPIAILDFDGEGISKQALIALTNQFRGNLVELKSHTILDRGKMSDILKEQGFQLTGCTSSECAVEAGKILNVRKMISGSIGKVGATYTINISLLDVQSSRIEKSYNRTYSGKVDGLLDVFKEIAYSMSGKSSKGKSKAPIYIFGTTALASVGFGAYSYLQGQKSYKSYQDAKTISEMTGFKNDTKKFNNYILYSAVAAGSSVLFYFIFDRIFNSGVDSSAISINLHKSNFDMYNFTIAINF